MRVPHQGKGGREGREGPAGENGEQQTGPDGLRVGEGA